MAMDTLGCFARSMMITTDGDRQRIYSDDFRRELQGYRAIELLKEHARVAGDLDPLRMAQYLMLKIYLPGDILTKVDRASMAHALEVRVPLLDHHFVEWAARLPGDFKIQPGRTKRILKSAFEKRLTSSIVHRKKMGFSIPLAEWLRGPLKERVRTALLCSDMEQLNLFSPNRLQMIFDEHQSRVRDHGPLLWSLMMFNESRSRILG
jgi:asparagine synthase (glutamine-hydrolysing)